MTATEPTSRATRPDASEYAPYYGTYISKVPDDDIVAVLARGMRSTSDLLGSIREENGGHRYAPGKWSIREVIGHLCDAERVFAYRAMRFARSDATNLPGFDENAFVANSSFDARTVTDLAEEFRCVRAASIAFFGTLNADEWLRQGIANHQPVSVRALAWICAGHELHHMDLLRTRYLV